ncbi:MAG: L-gulono,4-lactone dehydrogenase, partial [Solirubrobacterales bacterium]|nr:L-gulono,4-lactone dehydrogenase [Solirubrobacterales bacterium]
MDPLTQAGDWANWAGDQRCRPAKVVAPRSREELAEVVGAAAAAGEKVSVTGSGHSFTEAAMTDQTMLRLGALRGVLDADRASGLVRVGAGTVLADLNDELAGLGLALENLGDIDAQTVAGAISTGTHGTGAGFGNISARVEGIELVLADGSVRDLTAAGDPELLRAARIGVGALGAISAVTLRCFPAFTLRRVDSAHKLDDVLARFDELAATNDHFELFTFPYSDRALVLERNRTEEPPKPKNQTIAFLNDVLLENWALEAMAATGKAIPRTIPALARFAGLVATGTNNQDRSDRIFVNRRNVRFTEMEYAVPRA